MDEECINSINNRIKGVQKTIERPLIFIPTLVLSILFIL